MTSEVVKERKRRKREPRRVPETLIGFPREVISKSRDAAFGVSTVVEFGDRGGSPNRHLLISQQQRQQLQGGRWVTVGDTEREGRNKIIG
jgi:hypothetical protein